MTLDMITDDVSKRFTSKYEESDGCWEWIAGKAVGYGVISINGSSYKAHRVAYLIGNQEIDNDKVIDHLCENRACVKPSHLKQTTDFDNLHRSIYFGDADACPKGHNDFCYSAGTRFCRECRRIHQRKRYQRKLMEMEI